MMHFTFVDANRASRCVAFLLLATTFLLGAVSYGAPAASAQTEPARASASAAEVVGSRNVLKGNALYRAPKMRSASCAPVAQTPLGDSAGLLSYYRSVLPCLNKAWKASWKPMAKSGVKFRAPKVAVHNGRPAGPCSNVGPLSFYCPLNKTIYMYDAEITRPWNTWTDEVNRGVFRLAATHTLAHEYAHHVQELTGIMRGIKYNYVGKPGRQLELQASCLGNVWLSAQRDAYPVAAEYVARPEHWRYIAVAEHGSVANQKLWTERGYAKARPSACNTFKASNAQVL